MDLVMLEMCVSKLSVESIMIPRFLTCLEYVIGWLLMMMGGGVVGEGLLRHGRWKCIVSVFRGLNAKEL